MGEGGFLGEGRVGDGLGDVLVHVGVGEWQKREKGELLVPGEGLVHQGGELQGERGE